MKPSWHVKNSRCPGVPAPPWFALLVFLALIFPLWDCDSLRAVWVKEGHTEWTESSAPGMGAGKVRHCARIPAPEPPGSSLCLYTQDSVPRPTQKRLHTWDLTWKNSMFSLSFTSFFFLLHRTACGTLVPRPGIEPIPSAVEAQSLNYWTAREAPPLLNKT